MPEVSYLPKLQEGHHSQEEANDDQKAQKMRLPRLSTLSAIEEYARRHPKDEAALLYCLRCLRAYAGMPNADRAGHKRVYLSVKRTLTWLQKSKAETRIMHVSSPSGKQTEAPQPLKNDLRIKMRGFPKDTTV